jgi:tungstate transport system ATP-binding protein
VRRDGLTAPLGPSVGALPGPPLHPRRDGSAANGPALITLDRASVRFGAVTALADLSLALPRGEQVAVVGANGAGKTTLLRLLQGALGPGTPEGPGAPGAANPGTAARRVHAIDGRAPVIAMLFQRPFLLNLSVARNLRLALWLQGLPLAERAARCAQVLEGVGLAPLADRPARTLSGGQQQRLALARAWAMRPDVLLLDEPTASLDPSARREVEALIARLAADGVTIVMSTHNLGQAKRLATRVLYLDRGRLAVDLPTDRFFDTVQPPAAAAEFLRGELPWT